MNKANRLRFIAGSKKPVLPSFVFLLAATIFTILFIGLDFFAFPLRPAAASPEEFPPELARSAAYHYRHFDVALESGETFECVIPYVNHSYFDRLESEYGPRSALAGFFPRNESSGENILRMPFTAETLETEDPPFNPYRKKAFDDLKELIEICRDENRGNFDERYAKAAEKVYRGMLYKYANYSDICLASRLCLLDAIAAEYGGLFFRGSPFFFEYGQIKENYDHEPGSSRRIYSVSSEIDYGPAARNRFRIMDANLKKLIDSIDTRLAAIKANDAIVTAKIDRLHADNARLFEAARDAGRKMTGADRSGAAEDKYCDAARKILDNHIALYGYYMEIGRYHDARGVFEAAVEGGKSGFKGSFADSWSAISNPIAKADGAFNKRLEGLYTEMLYKMIFSYRLEETGRPARSEKEGGGAGLAGRIKACCEFVASDTREVSAPADGNVQKMRETAFGFAEKGIEKYFVSTPCIKGGMITLDEIRPNDPHMIIDPFDFITIRAMVDHRNNRAPFYPIESGMSAPSSGRKKSALLKFEYFTGSFFSKFRPNESREEESADGSLIEVSEGQKNPRPLSGESSARIDADISQAEARRKELEKNASLAPYLKRGFKGPTSSMIDRKRIAAIFNECITGLAPQAGYSVEIIASAPRSLEAAYAVDFMKESRWQAPARALYKELFIEHFDAVAGGENGVSLGMIILAYFMANGLSGTVLDETEAGYLSAMGRKALDKISEASPSTDLSALAHLFLINLSEEGLPEKYCAKFIEKYPGHPALPIIELKLAAKKAAWAKKSDYKSALSELERLSEKYKEVRIPFGDAPFSVEFDYWKIRLLLNNGRAEEARKIFTGIKKYCAGWPKFGEIIDDFNYMDDRRSLDKE